MRVDVAEIRNPLQEKFLAAQEAVAATASKLAADSPAKARSYLTQITRDACLETTRAYWNLGDLLWNKYDEKW
jgi:hypothetical protein